MDKISDYDVKFPQGPVALIMHDFRDMGMELTQDLAIRTPDETDHHDGTCRGDHQEVGDHGAEDGAEAEC